jgi:HK97 family phage portal protein
MLDLLFGRPKSPKATASDWFSGGVGYGPHWVSGRIRTNAGVVVDEDLALTYAALWCGARCLCEPGSYVPLNLMRTVKDGGKAIAADHSGHQLVRYPNPNMTGMPWREGRWLHQILWGNGFSEIVENSYGEKKEVWPIHPSRVRPSRPSDGALDIKEFPYVIRNNDGSQTPMKASEILHVPGVFAEDGVWGKGVVAYARECIGMGISTERHGATYFGSGGTARGVVKLPGLKDRDARQNFRAEWKQVHGSPDSGEVIILPVEGDFTPISVSNEAGQFIETRELNAAEICRILKIPPHFLGLLDKASYASIEMMSLEFVIYGLLPWLVRWEEQLNLKMLSEEERLDGYFFLHDLTGLLRGDFKTRMEGYKEAIAGGIMTINEARRLENWATVGPEGDELMFAANMTTVKKIMLALPPAGGEDRGSRIEDRGSSGSDGARRGSPDPDAPNHAIDQSDQVLELPDIRQQDTYSCGAAAAMAVGQFFGVGPATLEEWKTALNTTEANSTRPMEIVRVMTELGLAVTVSHDLTIDDLYRFWQQGKPTICCIQEYGVPSKQASFAYGHYVTVVAVWPGYLLVHDSSIDNVLEGQDADQAPGLMPIAYAKWLSIWHDQDADGKQYVRFGIAVGLRPDEEDDDEEEDDDTDTEEEDDDEDDDAAEDDDPAPPDPPGGSAAHAGRDAGRGTRPQTPGPGHAPLPDQRRQAAEALLADVLGRMFGKEAKAATRAAAKVKDETDWDTWLNSWHHQHRLTLGLALAAPCQVLASLGFSLEPEQIAHQVALESAGRLKQAFATQPADQFAATLASWPTERAQRSAADILRATVVH